MGDAQECRNCGGTVVSVDGAWWHEQELAGDFSGICSEPEPVSWRNERGAQ